MFDIKKVVLDPPSVQFRLDGIANRPRLEEDVLQGFAGQHGGDHNRLDLPRSVPHLPAMLRSAHNTPCCRESLNDSHSLNLRLIRASGSGLTRDPLRPPPVGVRGGSGDPDTSARRAIQSESPRSGVPGEGGVGTPSLAPACSRPGSTPLCVDGVRRGSASSGWLVPLGQEPSAVRPFRVGREPTRCELSADGPRHERRTCGNSNACASSWTGG